VRLPKTLKFAIDSYNPDDQYAKLFAPTIVDEINRLKLPRYGLGNYVHEQPRNPPTSAESRIISDLSRAGLRLMGFCRTNLFKRLESSGFAFLQSIERHILRNAVYLYALENDLHLPIGTQDSQLLDSRFRDDEADLFVNDDNDAEENDEPPIPQNLRTEEEFQLRAAQVYQIYTTQFERRFRWLPAKRFLPQLAKDLRADSNRDSPTRFHGRTSGALFADFDYDGGAELFAANIARRPGKKTGEPQASAVARHAIFFRNQKGKFINFSKESGATPDTLLSTRNVGAFDYNLDGQLDLLVVEDKFTAKPRSTLFRNGGGLKFEDVTREVGLPEDIFGLGLAVADLNYDGRPDFFVPHSNRLFLSVPENKYREAVELKSTFAWKPLDGEDWPCGAHFADLNRDGLLDLVMSIHHVKARNRVFLNRGLKNGIPQFEDVTSAVGLDAEIPARCPHVEVQDFDNDGWPDIYFSAAWNEDGVITPLIYKHQGLKNGLPQFVSPRPIKAPMVYFRAGPSVDFDGDGRIDLFLVNWFQGNHSRLLQNTSPRKSWIDVRVAGTKTVNRDGIGAKVFVYESGRLGEPKALIGYQEITVGYGYASGQLPVAHFGLDDRKAVDIRVTLTGLKSYDRPNTPISKMLHITE